MKTFALVAAVATVAATMTPFAAHGEEMPWMDSALAPEQRTELLMGAMTLEDKVDLVTGDTRGFLCGFMNNEQPDLGIPRLCMADGPQGVRMPFGEGGKATALPANMALAASWDPEAAYQYGELLGAETHLTGHNVQLGPGLDIARTSFGARSFEAMGEDPLLGGAMAGPLINGMQSNPILADAKHFTGYAQSAWEDTINVDMSERSMREIYFRGFDKVAEDAGTVMCAFPKVNGTFACDNAEILRALKEDLGFEGFVMSDWAASHSAVDSFNAGMDMETPGLPLERWGTHLLEKLQSGELSVAVLDDKVRRILMPMFKYGLFDVPAVKEPLPVEEHAQISRELAADSMVLLKNDDLLPLPSEGIDSIAVIGPDADNVSAAGGGSGLVNPIHAVSAVEGITARAGEGVDVQYAPGTDPIAGADIMPGLDAVPSSVLTPAGGAPGETGLKAEYWTNASFSGEPALVQTDPQANLIRGFFGYTGFNAASPKAIQLPQNLGGIENNRMSIRWTGEFVAPTTGEYTFGLINLGTSRFYLDDQLVIENRGSVPEEITKTVQLNAGESHSVRIEHQTDAPLHGHSAHYSANIRWGWQAPEGTVPPKMQEAIDLAKNSDVAVVVTRTYESEARIFDRTQIEMPNGQDQLIREIVKANPKTIVVTMSGAAVGMKSWIDEAPAVVQAWYAGGEQGAALADVLFGDVNPSGKLPVTFPVDGASTPFSTPESYPGDVSDCEEMLVSHQEAGAIENCTLHLSEGVFVGYRGYDQLGIEPQFPFGYGLSYTTFEYSDLKAKSTGKGKVSATFTVTNTGDRAGSEVAQVYNGKLPTDVVETAPKQLAGFVKVDLEAGESKQVTVDLDRESYSYWDAYANTWVTPKGALDIFVGASSRDVRLETTVDVKSSDKENTAGIDKSTPYSIVGVAYGRCIDAEGWGTTPGTRVQQWHCPVPQQNAQWTFTKAAGDDTYAITNVAAGLPLEVSGGSTEVGAALQLGSAVKGKLPESQLFQLQRVGEGAYHLVNKKSGLCLAAEGGTTQNGATIVQTTCSDDRSQSFLVNPQ